MAREEVLGCALASDVASTSEAVEGATVVEARESVALVGVLLRRNQRSIEHRVELHRMPWLVPTQSAATAHAELGGVQTRGCLRAPRPMMAAWGSAAGGSSLGPSTGRPSSRGSAAGSPGRQKKRAPLASRAPLAYSLICHLSCEGSRFCDGSICWKKSIRAQSHKE